MARRLPRFRAIGAVPTRLWQSKTFTGLPADTQLLHLALWTQRDVTAAGIVQLDLDHLAGLSPAWTPDGVDAALSGLRAARLVRVSASTGEILLRRWTCEVPDVTGSVPAVRKLRLAAMEVRDAELRGVLISDLERLLRGELSAAVLPHLQQLITDLAEVTLADPGAQGALFAPPAEEVSLNEDDGDGDGDGDGEALPPVDRAKRPLTQSDVVAAWRRAYQARRSIQPPASDVSRFAGTARALLGQGGYDRVLLLEAAEVAGREGWVDLSRGLATASSPSTSTVSYRHGGQSADDAAPSAGSLRAELAAALASKDRR